MLADIRLIGIDLDDTMLTDDKMITPATVAAIEKALGAGLVVMAATGRPLSGIPAEVLEIPGMAYALTTNGAKVYRLADRQVLYSDCLDTETALAILAMCEGFDVLASLFIDGYSYADRANFDILYAQVSPALRQYLVESRKPVDDLRALVESSEQPVEKFSLYFTSGDERDRAMQAFNARGDLSVTSSIAQNLELNTQTANKGAGLLALAKLLGIEKKQVMAIGDSSNDLEMIKAVGFGVAMGNAQAQVKQHADHVTHTNEQDGVAAAIEMVLEAREG